MNFDLGIATTRKPEMKDIEDIYNYRNDKDVYASLAGCSQGMSRENVEEWIHFHNHNNNDHVWVIVEKKTDKCIGHVGLYQIDFRNGKAEIGMAISKDYWGHGIAQLAFKELFVYAFEQMNLNRLETFNLATNKKIIHVKEKLGFVTEGICRETIFRNGKYQDQMVMAILRSDYLKLKGNL